MKLERRRTELGGYRIHSVHAGAGEPVVLLHGLSGSHRWWRYTIPALAERFTVHVPELMGLGHGGDTQPTGIPAAARVLDDWIVRLGLDPTHVVGHSMGGHIAIHLAANHPELVRRLVLAAPAALLTTPTPAELVQIAAELVPPRAWGRLSFLPTMAIDAVRTGPVAVWTSLRHILEDDVTPLLERIRAPTLLLWGENDPLIPVAHAHELARHIRDARVTVLQRAAHNAMADRPEAFNAAVLRFLGAS